MKTLAVREKQQRLRKERALAETAEAERDLGRQVLDAHRKAPKAEIRRLRKVARTLATTILELLPDEDGPAV